MRNPLKLSIFWNGRFLYFYLAFDSSIWFSNRSIAASRKTRFNADSVFEQVNETIGRRGASSHRKKSKDRGNNIAIAVFRSLALLPFLHHVYVLPDSLSR